ncbi:MAG: 4Fe-4S dicluster domain-containing protein, partial [Sediminibacterium sp.]|nr:4Fe-4S dicluster domain-containing protein [Sediminibacterium sp.]
APDIAIFEQFNRELANIILHKYGGSMKAEHGTGRQIAPFVKDEWGEEIYQIMCELKALADPHQILNPGVLINPDPACHLKNLKTNPIVEEEVDRCVECGYCENRCPSRNFTLTPRQRIQVRRSLQRLQQDNQKADYNRLLEQYQFAGLDTCAVDGMCAVDCPVAINTGDLIKRLRSEQHSKFNNRMAIWVARHFSLVAGTIRGLLTIGNAINSVFGSATLYHFTRFIRKGWKGFPLYMQQLSSPVRIQPQKPADYQLVYFSTCITRMMGSDTTDKQDSVSVLTELCQRAQLPLYIPEQTGGTCCGQLFSSKGFYPAYQEKVNQTIEDCWKWSKAGQIPIVLDVSSCTQSIRQSAPYLSEENKKRFEKLQFIDSVELVADWLLPRLTITQPKKEIILHPVCSLHKMGLTEKFKSIGAACAEKCIVPMQASCCGMAGDRGFYYPELTAAATQAEIAEIQHLEPDGCYSSGKTCEMALSEHSGKNYQSILYLLRDVTAPH